MAERKYLYTGPMTGVTLGDGREILLYPGKETTLPDDNEYVKTLVALKRLSPVEGDAIIAETKSATKKKEVKADAS